MPYICLISYLDGYLLPTQYILMLLIMLNFVEYLINAMHQSCDKVHHVLYLVSSMETRLETAGTEEEKAKVTITQIRDETGMVNIELMH